MDNYGKILKIAEDEKVELGLEMKNMLHTELCLGQTRWVCRNGTLSEGHEKITPSQRFYQAAKEIYFISNSIALNKATAMESQADLLDAQASLELASTPAQKLRAEAKILKANNTLLSALVSCEDQMRMLDEYVKIYNELKPGVYQQYPNGIEQAEKDNWEAIYRYRMIKEKTPGINRQSLDNIPLDPVTKAQLGFEHGRIDSIAALMITDPQKAVAISDETEKLKQLESLNNN